MASTSKATENARTVARQVSKVLGREVNAKRVRAWVRDHVAAFDDDGYTAHVYDARTAAAIVAGMTKGQTERSKAAQTGRRAAKRTPDAPRPDRKRTTRPPVPPMSGDKDGDA